MFEQTGWRLSWLFVALSVGLGAIVFGLGRPAGASDEHEQARQLRDAGDVLPLSELLNRDDLQGYRVIEAELENEHGRLVYELELLDPDGRVIERYYDAASGTPLATSRDE